MLIICRAGRSIIGEQSAVFDPSVAARSPIIARRLLMTNSRPHRVLGYQQVLLQPVAVIASPKRELTAAEKLFFAPFLSAGLKDSSAAQFKWLPVILTERDGITDYCGLVNGKNNYGGYTALSAFTPT